MNKKNAALLSVGSNSFLVVIKLTAGIVSGSVGILSEALHSLMDLGASFIAYFSIKQASLPPDKEHPFGHGKMENLSGLFEAVLLLAASLFIIYESLRRLMAGKEIGFPLAALLVMGLSAGINVFVSRYLYRVAHATDSLAIEADAKHLSADVYTSIGVFAGLVLVVATGNAVFDPIIAMIVALYIFYEGVVLAKKSIGGLMDTKLPDEEEQLIRKVLDGHKGKLMDYHNLRTRKSGSERHVDFHALICRDANIEATHDLMDGIEKELQVLFPDTKVLIHPEPCTHHTAECPAACHWNGHKEKNTIIKAKS